MGNSSSSSGRAHHDDSVDYGSLTPQGVYTGPRDWNQAIVSQLIVARKLAPFYRPLEEYEDSWDDDQILAARKELPDDNPDTMTRIETTHTSASKASHSKRPGLQKEPCRPEAALYRGAVECPICFLYYPPNINHSRCCDQAICTECFVQIKRSEPTTTHVVSEPAACPYCVQDNFGIVYTPPPWRAGLNSDGSPSRSDSPRGSQQSTNTLASAHPTHKRRQKSYSADSPEVVTTDQIRPDWEAKLAAVRAAVARRANRRIIMRQVGDRLIPVGVTSGRVHALSPEEAANAEVSEGGGSRRSRRRQQANQSYEQYVGMSGQDLEELMIMEAMRLSLLEHEEQQRKEAEEKKKKGDEAASASAVEGQPEISGTSLGLQAVSGPGLSTLEARLSPQTSTTSPIPSSSLPDESGIPVRTASPAYIAESQSTSRGQTPPPNVNSNSSLLDDTSSIWRSRTPSPSPFSSATAALASASATAAFLGTRSVEGSSTASNDRESTVSQDTSTTSPIPVPSITVGAEEISKPNGIASSHLSENSLGATLIGTPTPGTQASDIDPGAVETRNKGLPSGGVPNQSSSFQ